MRNMRPVAAAALSAAFLLLQGCAAVTRVTTTERTAVEEALLTQSIERAIEALDVSGYAGMAFVIEDGLVEIPQSVFVHNTLRRHLLASGLIEAPTTPTTELRTINVTPVVSHLGIDDDRTFIGFPAIPLIIPLVGLVEVTEVALLRVDHQMGRSRIGIFAHDAETGALVFDTGTHPYQTHFKRWRVLIAFRFRTTNLERPF